MINFINTHPTLSAIIVIIIFLAAQFFMSRGKKEEESPIPVLGREEQTVTAATNLNSENNINKSVEKESTAQRIKRGFAVMQDKLANSNYVQGMREEQKTAKFSDMLPPELLGGGDYNEEDRPEPPKKKSKQIKPERPMKDPWATDFSKLGEVDF